MEDTPMKLFYNFNIICDNNTILDNFYAILTNNGIITKIDKLTNITDYLNENNLKCAMIDGKNKFLMPSFVDSHSHFSKVLSDFCYLNLSGVTSLSELKDKIDNYISSSDNKDDLFICNNLQFEIDEAFLDLYSNYNILINYYNGHMGYFTSSCQRYFNIDGYLKKENEYFSVVLNLDLSAQMQKYIPKTLVYYKSFGFSTICDGYVTKSLVDFYSNIIDKNLIDTNLNLIVEYNSINYCYKKLPNLFKVNTHLDYYNNLTVSAIKLVLDGSIQSDTAYISSSYPSSDNRQNHGQLSLDRNTIIDAINKAYELQIGLHIHVNGDKAIKFLLEVVRDLDIDVVRKVNITLIHAQLLDVCDLDLIKHYNMNVSYFASHIYHFADSHYAKLGDVALRISPIASTISKGITTTIHDDTPVIEPNMFSDFSYAIERISKGNLVLCKDEKVTINDCIALSSFNGYRQYNLSDKYSYLHLGCYFNALVCDRNIFNQTPKNLKNTKILEVYLKANRIF